MSLDRADELANTSPGNSSLLPRPGLGGRDPAELLAQARAQWAAQGAQADLWVFGYASLIWRREFEVDEQRPAVVFGYHRCFRMRSRINRGTPVQPGLVFALVHGGSCAGVAYRVDRARASQVLEALWQREMPTGVYSPRWLPCRTPGGLVRALAFTLERSSPSFIGSMEESQLVDILRHAQGRYGKTLDYLLDTARSLRELNIRDREIERMVRLARQHGLAP